MKPGITSLTIEGFRALQHLTITGLGRVNLITGRNNTGKSSVLEALRILTSDASLSIIFSILSDREEDIGEIEEMAWRNDADSLFQLASLFSGFPQLTDPFQPKMGFLPCPFRVLPWLIPGSRRGTGYESG